jgi:hypothetical protein
MPLATACSDMGSFWRYHSSRVKPPPLVGSMFQALPASSVYLTKTCSGASAKAIYGANQGVFAGAVIGGMVGVGIDMMEDHFASKQGAKASSTSANSKTDEDKRETVDLYRSVSEKELKNIMDTGKFQTVDGAMEYKQFGRSLQETKSFRDKLNEPANHIVGVTVDKNSLDRIGDTTPVDSFNFRSGTISIHETNLDEFNASIIGGVRRFD